jgi:hypothetical protein
LWEFRDFGSLSSAGPLQFEFQNLGGVTTGVNYQLLKAFSSPSVPSTSNFSFAPDMAAQGWAGTFSATASGVFVKFSAVPEPELTAALLIQGVACAVAARRRLCKRQGAP